MTIDINFSNDEKTYRHQINDVPVVSHPHHYTVALTQLAASLEEYNAIEILAESAEDSIRPFLDEQHARSNVSSPEEKLEETQKIYEYIGLGKIEYSGDEKEGEVVLTRSHVDEGWLSKLGRNDRPVNHLTRGLIAAMFASAYNVPGRSYEVTETASLVMGDSASRFSVKRK
jgi:predicted hydrocarbon binding protein